MPCENPESPYMTTGLLIIDPQNDFCDPDRGALYVPGAEQDMERLASFITTRGGELDDIVISLDSHQRMDISHPLWWVNPEGIHPKPFTSITPQHMDSGSWQAARESDQARSAEYVRTLAAGDRYPHIIWPEHCIVGHWGHNVWPTLHRALGEWEAKYQRRAHYVYKGTNEYTEHFSAIRAEVIDPEDKTTQVNDALLTRLEGVSTLYIAGEARSHCVANTVRDLAAAKPALVSQMILLGNTTSDVPGFTALGEAFVQELTQQGMREQHL